MSEREESGGEGARQDAALVLHPVRLRIIQALSVRPMTVSELSARLGDVPRPSIYRHMRKLEAGGFLEVAETQVVRGGAERTWTLARSAHLGAEAVEGCSGAEHVQLFSMYVGTLLGAFTEYVEAAEARGGVDMAADRVGYSEVVFHATDEEFDAAVASMRSVISLLRTFQAGPGRTPRKLATITFPVELPVEGGGGDDD